MTASFRARSTTSATLGGDPVVNVPAGTQNGDLLIAFGICAAGGTITAPAGWTLSSASQSSQGPLYTRVASSEPASYTFTVSGTANSTVTIVCIQGVHASTPIDVASGVIAASGDIVIPSVTTTGTDRLLVQLVAKLLNTSFTGPGSQTERFDSAVAPSSYTTAGGDEVVGLGSTGSRTWQPASSTAGSVGYMLAIAAPSVSATVNAVAASMSSTAVAPALSAGSAVSAPAAAASLSASVPVVGAGASLAAPTPAASISAPPPAVSAGASVTPPAAATTTQAPVPGLEVGSQIDAAPAAITLVAHPPGLIQAGGTAIASAPAVILDFQAPVPSVEVANTVDAESAAFSLASPLPSILAGASVDAAGVAIAFTAHPAEMTVGVTIEAPPAVVGFAAHAPRVNYFPRQHRATVTDQSRRTSVVDQSRATTVAEHARTTTVREAL